MPDEEHDPLPAFIAAIDQAMSTAPQLARYGRALFDAFMEEGFTEDQSLRLTIAKLSE